MPFDSFLASYSINTSKHLHNNSVNTDINTVRIRTQFLESNPIEVNNLNRHKYEPTFEKNENRRFHAHRAVGRDRHHRHSGGHAVAGIG